MCRVLGVSGSGYYQWRKEHRSQGSTKFQQKKKQMDETIKNIYEQSKGRYGSPKITKELQKQGFRISPSTVSRRMGQMNLRSIIIRKFKVSTTDSSHNYPIAPNLLKRNFECNEPAQCWVSDITYIPTQMGFVYLTAMMDLFDRQIIGWALSDNLRAQDTVIAAWNMSVINRRPSKEMIFHSDRGSQYACTDLREVLSVFEVRQSMSRKANCWDNAVAESFFKILKSELVNHRSFQNKLQAKLAIFEFIEMWYNTKRTHSTLGYLSPKQFYQNYLSNVA